MRQWARSDFRIELSTLANLVNCERHLSNLGSWPNSGTGDLSPSSNCIFMQVGLQKWGAPCTYDEPNDLRATHNLGSTLMDVKFEECPLKGRACI